MASYSLLDSKELFVTLKVFFGKKEVSTEQLKHSFGLTKGAVSQQLNSLSRAGLVEFKKEEKDKRVKQYSLSMDGFRKNFVAWFQSEHLKVKKLRRKRLNKFKGIPGFGSIITLSNEIEKKHKITQDVNKAIGGFFNSERGKKQFNSVIRALINSNNRKNLRELYLDYVASFAERFDKLIKKTNKDKTGKQELLVCSGALNIVGISGEEFLDSFLPKP